MRKTGLIVSAVGAAVLAFGASAWACTNLASLNPSVTSGNPGTQVSITGTAFATKGGGDVAIRWDSVTGQPLVSVKADATGTIRAQVIIPADAKPGPHVLIATQDYTDGSGVTTAAYGTPARASFTVGAGTVAAPTPAASATTSAGTESSSGSSGGLIALTALLGLSGFILFGAGLAVFARQSRRRPVPATVDKK